MDTIQNKPRAEYKKNTNRQRTDNKNNHFFPSTLVVVIYTNHLITIIKTTTAAIKTKNDKKTRAYDVLKRLGESFILLWLDSMQYSVAL